MQCPHCPKMERLQRFANHLSGHHRRQFAMDTMYELVKAYNRRSPFVKAYGVYCCLGCGVAYKTSEQSQKHNKEGCWYKAMMLICDMVYIGFKANPEAAPPGVSEEGDVLSGFRIKIEQPKAEGPTIRIKRRPVAPVLPPVQQEVIVASVVEPAEPAIEVTSITRIALKSLTVDGVEYWLSKDKVYEKRRGRGAYIGRYDGSKIDCTADDSDDE